MASSTYTQDKVIAASRTVVNIVGDQDTGHGQKEVIVGREKKQLCKEFWNIPCDVHVKCYGVTGKFDFGGSIGMPCTLWTGPDGKELKSPARKSGAIASSALIKQFEESVKQVPGEHVPYDTYAAAKKNMDEGDAALDKPDYKKAIESYQKVTKMKLKSLKEMGDAGLKRVEDRGTAMFEEAQGKVESDKEEAKKILKALSEQFKPLEIAKKAADLLKTLQ